VGLISNPAGAAYFHDRNDRMPAFVDQHMLTPQEIELLADWLRGDWYEPPNPPRAAANSKAGS
jgi:mono/diheme cytochrome c family protein